MLYLKITAKLTTILGLVEIFGYIQTGYQGNEEKVWVVAFGFLYTLCRSFRGLALWFVYIYCGTIAKRYQKRLSYFTNRTRIGPGPLEKPDPGP